MEISLRKANVNDTTIVPQDITNLQEERLCQILSKASVELYCHSWKLDYLSSAIITGRQPQARLRRRCYRNYDS